MSPERKNTARKSKKTKQPKTTIRFSRVPVEETVLPEKFSHMNEVHKKTTFLP
jgi:hypothetical protein